MTQKTILAVVQDISSSLSYIKPTTLTSLNPDNQRILDIVRNQYSDILQEEDWSFMEQLTQLENVFETLTESADDDKFAVNQTPSGAGTLTLTSTLSNAEARFVICTAVSDERNRTFTIVGLDIDGENITEDISGPNTGAVVSTTGLFKSIVSISTDASTNNNIKFGTVAETRTNPEFVSLKIPVTHNRVTCLRYRSDITGDTVKKWRDIYWREPCDFIRQQQSVDDTLSNTATVTVVNGGVGEFYVFNDRPPTYYTSFDDEFIFFDSYDSAIETQISPGRAQAMAVVEPALSLTSTTTPKLPANFFTYLHHSSKAVAWLELKQQRNPISEGKARRSRVKLNIFLADRANRRENINEYGRQRGRSGSRYFTHHDRRGGGPDFR